MRPEKDRLRVDACSNGWLLVYEEWDDDKQQWKSCKAEVYQDPEIMLLVMRDQVIERSGDRA